MANAAGLPGSCLSENSFGTCDTGQHSRNLSRAAGKQHLVSSRLTSSSRIRTPKRSARRPRMHYLRRLRILEGENLLPSVEPFNKIILSFDFYHDIREEALAEDSLPGNLDKAKEQGASKENTSPSESPTMPAELKPGSFPEVPTESASASPAEHPPAAPENENAATPETPESEAEPVVSTQDSSGAESPNSTADESDDEFATSRLRSVPTYFRDAEDYVDTFFPLLIQEAKQCIHRAKRMEMSGPEKFVQVRSSAHFRWVVALSAP